MASLPSLLEPAALRTYRIAVFGPSLVSAYRNEAATYFRGMVRALDDRGHRVTFYELDALERQEHRDLDDPTWARVVVLPATERSLLTAVASARDAHVVLKAGDIGVFDTLLERAVLDLQDPARLVGFWDVDPPATLERLRVDADDPLASLIPRFDFVLTRGGGLPVGAEYSRRGARAWASIPHAIDPITRHPSMPDARFACDVALLADRVPDRERRIRETFLEPAALLPHYRFLVGGAGWHGTAMPPNVRAIGPVPPADYNAFYATPLAVVHAARDRPMLAGNGPEPEILEAAGAGACVIVDANEPVEGYLEPGREVLVARNGQEVADRVRQLDTVSATAIGRAARRRILIDQTYARRAAEFEARLRSLSPALEVHR